MPRHNRVPSALLPELSVARKYSLCSRRASALALLLFVAFAPRAFAQALELSGQVLDPQRLRVADARVRLLVEDAAGQKYLSRETRADSEGAFHFSELSPGKYWLDVSAPGFQRNSRPVEFHAALALDVELNVAGPYQGIVVTSTREEGESLDATLPTAVLSSQSLNRRLPESLARGLADLPGVNWVNAAPFSTRPVIRGLDSNRILILVDGERLNNSRTATGFAGIETSLIDFSQIDQVEVVRGPGSVLYGSDAFGGVVNILTRSAAPAAGPYFGGRLRGELFSNSDTRRAHAELFGGGRRFSLRAAGSVGAVQDYHSPRGTVFGTALDENDSLAEARFYPAQNQSLFFKFLFNGGYNFGLPSLERDPIFLGTFPFSKLRKFSWGYQGSFNSSAFSALQARFYQQNQNRDFSNLLRVPGFSLFSDTVTNVASFGFDLQATSTPGRQHVLTYGVTLYRDSNRDQRIQILNPDTAPFVLSRAPSVPNSALAGTGFFLQDQFAATSRLRFIGGVRLDRFALSTSQTANFDPTVFSAVAKDRTDVAISGNFGASFQVRSGWLLTANVARAFREPNLFERYFFGRGSVGGFVVPSPNLKPESSVQFDFGTRVQAGPLHTSLNYFLNELTDLITTRPGSFMGMTKIAGQPVVQNANIAKSRIQGVEGSAELAISGLRSHWTPFLNLAWQRGTDRTNGAPLPLIAPFVSHVGLRWQPSRLRAWSEWRADSYKGGNRVPPGSTLLSGYSVFSWAWGYELVRGERGPAAHLPRGFSAIKFHFAWENFTNKFYRGIFETIPNPGRNFRTGLEFEFDSRSR